MCDNPRKIRSNHECPVDNIVYLFVKPLSYLFHEFNATPNQITTLSLITGIMAIYYSINKNLKMFTFFFVLSYILDCVDGYYARKYNMVTEFGDLYDHFKDYLIVGIIIFIIFKNCYKRKIYKPIIILSILMYLSAMHIGCQQIQAECNDNNSRTINIFKKLCPCSSSPNNAISTTRYFGMGTLIISIVLIMWYLFYKSY